MKDGRARGEQLVEEMYAQRVRRDEPRRPNSLRPSELGHECTRRLWYRFRWADEHETFDGRMLRLFERGQLEEDRFIQELKWVGATVYAQDPDDPMQQIPMSLWNGQSKGFLDGVAEGVPFANNEYVLTEFKTHGDKSFKQLKKDGCAVSKPTHFAQCQLYMHEHHLKECLYLAVNKNTDELYAEYFDYDEAYAKRLVQKAERIIFRNDIPQRINEQPTFYVCKFCSANKVCHERERPTRSCRTCMHGRPQKEGGWICKRHGHELGLPDQKRGCDDHRYHPHLVTGENVADHREEEVRPNSSLFRYIYDLPEGQFVDEGPGSDR